MKSTAVRMVVIGVIVWTILLMFIYQLKIQNQDNPKLRSSRKHLRNITRQKWSNQTLMTTGDFKSSKIKNQKLKSEKTTIPKSNGKYEPLKIEENITLKSSQKNKLETRTKSIKIPIKPSTSNKTIKPKTQMTFRSGNMNKNFSGNYYQLDITKLKVYVYNLEPKFNLDAINCLNKRPKHYTHGAGCHYEENKGFGPSTGKFIAGVKTFKQCQHGVEVIFHNKLLNSQYRTENPEEADLFFVPYYASLVCFCQENVGGLEEEIWHVLNNSKLYRQKRPHFFAIAVPQRDLFSNPNWTPHCHFLKNRTQSEFVKYAHIESSSQLKDGVTVPRESYIHFDSPNVKFPHIKKEIFIFMAGKPLGKPLRKILIKQLTKTQNNNHGKKVVFFSMTTKRQLCWNSIANSSVMCILKSAQRSVFCLQPPGDTPTRKSFYDTLLTGCIPVIFTPYPTYFYPFQNLNTYNYLFNYDNFTVYINEERITKHGENIIDILSQIPTEKIKSMQRHILSIAKYFQYGAYSDGEDAFTMSLRTILTAFNLEERFMKKQT